MPIADSRIQFPDCGMIAHLLENRGDAQVPLGLNGVLQVSRQIMIDARYPCDYPVIF